MSLEAKHVLILMNPRAGARRAENTILELQQRINAAGYSTRIYSDLDAVVSTGTQLLADGQLRAVVAAGGDGTAAALVNRMPAKTPIALLPLGTENLLAKYLGIERSAEQVCEIICRGLTAELDVGEAGGRLFLLMLGCGFDADVVRRLHHQRTGNIRHWSYAKPILAAIRNYSYPPLRIYFVDDQATPVLTVRWAFIQNLPRYAGGLNFIPDAAGSDGALDICTFESGSLWNGLRYLTAVLCGWHLKWSDCRIRKLQRVRIEADEPVPYQLDGDPGGTLPVEVQVLPRRLTVLVPSHWADQHREISCFHAE